MPAFSWRNHRKNFYKRNFREYFWEILYRKVATQKQKNEVSYNKNVVSLHFKYRKAMQKIVIKNVVEWADKRIEKTKKVIVEGTTCKVELY